MLFFAGWALIVQGVPLDPALVLPVVSNDQHAWWLVASSTLKPRCCANTRRAKFSTTVILKWAGDAQNALCLL